MALWPCIEVPKRLLLKKTLKGSAKMTLEEKNKLALEKFMEYRRKKEEEKKEDDVMLSGEGEKSLQISSSSKHNTVDLEMLYYRL